MKKTYITTMPNHIGAFLKASECFAALGINITRVSYNKAVDSHTLFIDAEGDEAQLRTADEQLARIGYLQTEESNKGIVLLEFHLKDVLVFLCNTDQFLEQTGPNALAPVFAQQCNSDRSTMLRFEMIAP